MESRLERWRREMLAKGYRYVLASVGEQGRYGVRDVETGELVRYRADGRWRKWSSVKRAIEGVNALNGWQSYTYNAAQA